jgi:hypothetical protein
MSEVEVIHYSYVGWQPVVCILPLLVVGAGVMLWFLSRDRR